ncbi:MAG: LptA/OstA family protein, partial [Pseudomonadota bacterium]|nr:LptA/OstA family protein [Pseudomonadota bacterium]
MFQFLSVSRAGNRTRFVLLCAGMLAVAPAATVAQDQNAPLTIEADDLLEWNQTDGVYTAKGNAVAVQGEAEIRGNLLVATYDPKAESADIETITATGRVSFKDETSNASGGKLIYNIATSDYRVEGPKASVSGTRGKITASNSIDLDTQPDET